MSKKQATATRAQARLDAIEIIRQREKARAEKANAESDARSAERLRQDEINREQIRQKVDKLVETFDAEMEAAMQRLEIDGFADGQVLPVVTGYNRKQGVFRNYDELIIEERAVWRLGNQWPEAAFWVSSECELIVSQVPRLLDMSDFLVNKVKGFNGCREQLQVINAYYYFGDFKKDSSLFERIIASISQLHP